MRYKERIAHGAKQTAKTTGSAEQRTHSASPQFYTRSFATAKQGTGTSVKLDVGTRKDLDYPVKG